MTVTTRTRESGLSLVEVTIAVALTTIVMVAAVMTLRTGNQSSKDLLSDIDAERTIRKVLQQFSTEVRFASRQGEDTNSNNIFDTGEDTNGNGRLEDDWNLTLSSLTFNVRRSDGGFSLPIQFTLVGDELRRIVQDASGQTSVTVIARNVTRFRVKDSGGGISAELRLQAVSKTGAVLTRTRSITVQPRN
jgi:type II secretory pathway component PulJ